MIDLALILACAPNVHPTTIEAIIKVESEGKPLGLNANYKNGVAYPLPKEIKSRHEAVKWAKSAIKAGHSVDLGYMQVNSRNLEWLGYTIEDMFEPCKNLAAGARIYTAAYVAARKMYKNEQTALWVALSIYNTGNPRDGFHNGYVQRYVEVARTTYSRQDPHKAKTAVDSSKRRSVWGKVTKE